MTDATATEDATEGFRAALRRARLAEAAHAEAVMGLSDSKSIRLQLLKDDLVPIVASNPEAADLFDLVLVSGGEPRLWIDLVSFVVMAPDYRTYRLVEDRRSGREILIESAERGELVERIRQQMAHRLVARQRLAAPAGPAETVQGYPATAVILAWLSGFALGALGLLAAAFYAGKFPE